MSAPPLGVEQGNRWSTTNEEASLIEWVSQQILPTVVTLGTTREDRPISMITFGDTEATPSLLLIGGQHGQEPSGRELLLWWVREMAQGGFAGLRRGRSVAIIPNASPDSRHHNTRENTVGIHPNRDHYTLVEAEAQAINTAWNQVDPVMVVDLHEYGHEDADVWMRAHERLDTHPLIAQAGDDAVSQAWDNAELAGYDVKEFRAASRFTIGGVAPLRHCVGILIENRIHGWSRPERVDSQRPSLETFADYFTNNTGQLVHAARASRTAAASRIGPDLLQLWADRAREGNGRYVHLDGYDLAEPIPQRLLDAHGITVDGSFVPLRQPARGLIPELIDPDAADPVAEATQRLSPTVPEGELAGAYFNIEGQLRQVTHMIHDIGGQRRHVSEMRRRSPSPELLDNGLFLQGMDHWTEFGETTGSYEPVDYHAGKFGAIFFHGDGTSRIESPLLLDSDGVRLELTVEVWVGQAGERPGQLQIANLDNGSLIGTPINPAAGALNEGWSTIYGTITLSDQGRTGFTLRLSQVSEDQQAPSYWRVTRASAY